jgi:hypothetical protein
MTAPFVGVQLGPNSVFDEGPDRCLDLLQEKAAVNAVLVYTHTYYAAHGRAPEHMADDHGVPLRDERERNLTRVWVEHHEQYFRDTILRHPRLPDREYAGRDVLATLAEPCRRRGIKLYGRILDPHASGLWAEGVANALKAAVVDAFGRPTHKLCWNNPHYAGLWRGTLEDLFRTYPLDGFQFGAEHAGPLSRVLFAGHEPWCFCSHCIAKADRSGIDHQRARLGFIDLYRCARTLRDGGPEPPDGRFAVILRHLIKTPEILAWHRLMWESYLAFVAALYGTVKTLAPHARFLLHVDHQQTTLDLLHRALMDVSELADVCDAVKPILYHEIAGSRIRTGALRDRMRTAIGPGLDDPQLLRLFYALAGYDADAEPAFEELDRGMSPDYVYRETRRFIAGTGGKADVYPGIGLDTATTTSRPENVYAAIRRAFDAGATGIVLSREYDEMRVPTLEAAGRAAREYNP